jgi:thymidylate kinase
MKFLVVTGPDASGKDTHIRGLCEDLAEYGLKARPVGIWDSMPEFVEASQASRGTIEKVLQTFLLRFEPAARSLFLQSVLRNALAKAQAAGDADVLLYNGYVYKYWASELAYGVEPRLWQGTPPFLFPEPELVVVVNTPLEHCLARRPEWSPYESGKARSVDGRPMSLEQFQRRVHENFFSLMHSRPGARFVDGRPEIDDVQAEIRAIVRAHLKLARA